MQFNSGGAFAGDAALTWSNIGLANTLHASLGNYGTVDSPIWAPGDPPNESPMPGSNIALSINEYMSGDLSLSAEICGITDYSTFKHTGTDKATFFGLDIEPTIASDSTGPVAQMVGITIWAGVYGNSVIDNVTGVYAGAETDVTNVNNTANIFGVRAVPAAGANQPYMVALSAEPIVHDPAVVTGVIGVSVVPQFEGAAGATGYYGISLISPVAGSVKTNGGSAIYIHDHSAASSVNTCYNFYSQGPTALNVFEGGVLTTPSTVSALPAASAARKGSRRFVTDATQTFASANFGVTVTGGGANNVPVVCDGTAWKIG